MKDRILQLENVLQAQKSEIDSLGGELKFISSSIVEKTERIEQLQKDKQTYKKAVELLQIIEKNVREQTRESFETIVSHALRSVFEEGYEFKLEFGRRGNLPELNFNIQSPGRQEYLDPLESESGGVLDLCSLALRLVLIEIARPKIEGFIVLDEVFKHLSKNHLENAITFLKEINKKLNRQIIFVSHIEGFIESADNSIKIGS